MTTLPETSTLRPFALDARVAFAAAAAALPSLLAYNLAPSPTFLNQALALALWGTFVLVATPARPARAAWPLWMALGGVALGVLWSWGPGALPASLALSALGMLAATALLVAAGAGARRRDDAVEMFAAFATGWVVAGVANVAIAWVQVFRPDLADGSWIAVSGLPGRAVGNLRQPNHLSSLLLWALIGAVALLELRRLKAHNAALLMILFVFGVVLTASRTGLVSVVLLAAWALLDRRLARPARAVLLAAPLVYALAWLGMAEWAKLSTHAFGGEQRLAETDISSSRFGIWADTLALMRRYPLAGVGFGEFNFAWTLTPFPQRPTAFFDHTHNLPLQLLVELGLPLGGAVLALLAWALVRAFGSGWRGPAADDDTGRAQRMALLMVLMIGLHSLLEYPLWYAYFLLPAAWAWGYALAGDGSAPAAAPLAAPRPAPVAAPSAALGWGGAALVVLAVLSVYDYLRVTAIFDARDDAAPLATRIAAGEHSVLFAHHAYYAAVTADVPMPDAARAFASTTHYLLDTRLMMAWADWLETSGHDDRARYVAARLREFRKSDAAEFFAGCEVKASDAARAAASASSADTAAAPSSARSFACLPPRRAHDWREFLAH
ncbi:MAG: O-antigen ligase C-terminal domain-containing protein [Burkholderiales bacterium]|nr:O-antigen ligase C-terminal domain-containing protein [Burkholderiales bacterium]